MSEEDTMMPQLKLHYFWGKLDNHFEKFVELVQKVKHQHAAIGLSHPVLKAKPDA
jgi:hypothetical protein